MLFHTVSDAMPFLPLMPPWACLFVCPMLCFIGLFLIDDAQANMGLFVHKLRRTLFSLVAHNLPHAVAMVACVVGTTLELLLCGCLLDVVSDPWAAALQLMWNTMMHALLGNGPHITTILCCGCGRADEELFHVPNRLSRVHLSAPKPSDDLRRLVRWRSISFGDLRMDCHCTVRLVEGTAIANGILAKGAANKPNTLHPA